MFYFSVIPVPRVEFVKVINTHVIFSVYDFKDFEVFEFPEGFAF